MIDRIDEDGAANIELVPGGETFDARPDESVLEAALRHGLNLPHSCRGGSCMSCKAQLLGGEVRYPHDRLPPGITAEEAASGAALLCQAHARGDLRIAVREVLPAGTVKIRRMPCRVARIEQPAEDVRVVYLQLPKAQPLEFRAGQYLDVILRDGRRRSFSIACPPEDSAQIELHIRHVPGGEFTDFVFEQMQPKSLLRVEGPLGGFFLREESKLPAIFVAGGTGYAPVKAMLRHARHLGGSSPLSLYWGARHPGDLYEHDWVFRLTQKWPRFSYVPVLSEAAKEDKWTGRTGWVHDAVLEDYPDLSGHEVYASGPPPMIAAIQEHFVAAGLVPERLHFDSFEYGADTLEKLAED